MFIHFESTCPFAIKVYTGSVNAISGKPAIESLGENPIQDYIVVPDQEYLDGVASSPGLVRQFVANPSGSRYGKP
jgi:hypothetical protein